MVIFKKRLKWKVKINFRWENGEALEKLLSEDSRRKRNRNITINIQMTAISWLVEFVAGIIVLVTATFIMNDATSQILAVTDSFLCFVVIPSSYILKLRPSGISLAYQ